MTHTLLSCILPMHSWWPAKVLFCDRGWRAGTVNCTKRWCYQQLQPCTAVCMVCQCGHAVLCISSQGHWILCKVCQQNWTSFPAIERDLYQDSASLKDDNTSMKAVQKLLINSVGERDYLAEVDWERAAQAYTNLEEMPSFISRQRQSAAQRAFTTTAATPRETTPSIHHCTATHGNWSTTTTQDDCLGSTRCSEDLRIWFILSNFSLQTRMKESRFQLQKHKTQCCYKVQV